MLHYCSVLISRAGKGRHSPERCGSYTSATRAAARRILSCTARGLAAFCSALTKSALAMYASLAHGAREPTRRLGLCDVVNSDSSRHDYVDDFKSLLFRLHRSLRAGGAAAASPRSSTLSATVDASSLAG